MSQSEGALSRAYRLGAYSRGQTIAAWVKTLVDSDAPLERVADWIEREVYLREVPIRLEPRKEA